MISYDFKLVRWFWEDNGFFLVNGFLFGNIFLVMVVILLKWVMGLYVD